MPVLMYEQPPVDTTPRSMVDALLAEREEYVRRQLPDRVRQVDEQLAIHSHTPQPALED